MGDGEVACVDFESGELGDFLFSGGEGGGADAEEGVEEDGVFALAVEAEALFNEGRREAGGMGSVGVAGGDCFVGDEPGVSPAPLVVAFGVLPAADVRFVGVGDPSASAIEGDVSGFGEVKNVFVAVVDVARGVDGFEVAYADLFSCCCVYGDGFDPMKGVL